MERPVQVLRLSRVRRESAVATLSTAAFPHTARLLDSSPTYLPAISWKTSSALTHLATSAQGDGGPADDIKAPANRRERNKRAVRERIIDAAVDLIVEKGFANTTMDEVAERADVARATVFNHFTKKQDLIHGWTDRRRRALLDRFATSADHAVGIDELLNRTFDLIADINESERTVTVALVSAWAESGGLLVQEPFLVDFFASALRTAQAKGEIRQDVDVVDAAHLLQAIYLEALLRWSVADAGKSFSLRASLNSGLAIVLTGLLEPAKASSGRTLPGIRRTAKPPRR